MPLEKVLSLTWLAAKSVATPVCQRTGLCGYTGPGFRAPPWAEVAAKLRVDDYGSAPCLQHTTVWDKTENDKTNNQINKNKDKKKGCIIITCCLVQGSHSDHAPKDPHWQWVRQNLGNQVIKTVSINENKFFFWHQWDVETLTGNQILPFGSEQEQQPWPDC